MKASINNIINQTPEIKSFRISIEAPLKYKPGQYVLIAFPEMPDEKKAFSIVSYDSDKKELQLIIKKHGPFTDKLFASGIGQELIISGPYGRFTLPDNIEKDNTPVIFIAGGIGITPIYSMISNYVKSDITSSDAHLFYSAKQKDLMVLHDDIDALRFKGIDVNFYFTEQGSRINIEDIQKLKCFYNGLYYICGPMQMINDFRNKLIESGIPSDNIKSEDFT